jgi:hypothetical protein
MDYPKLGEGFVEAVVGYLKSQRERGRLEPITATEIAFALPRHFARKRSINTQRSSVRIAVRYARTALRLPVASHPGVGDGRNAGYWWALNPDEVEKTLANLRQRVVGIREDIEALEGIKRDMVRP